MSGRFGGVSKLFFPLGFLARVLEGFMLRMLDLKSTGGSSDHPARPTAKQKNKWIKSKLQRPQRRGFVAWGLGMKILDFLRYFAIVRGVWGWRQVMFSPLPCPLDYQQMLSNSFFLHVVWNHLWGHCSKEKRNGSESPDLSCKKVLGHDSRSFHSIKRMRMDMNHFSEAKPDLWRNWRLIMSSVIKSRGWW